MRPLGYSRRPIAAEAATSGPASGVQGPLVRCRPGTRATVASISPGAAVALADIGVLPGAEIAVERVIPFGGPVVLRMGTARVALGRRLAAAVMVEVAREGGAPASTLAGD